MSHIIPPKAGDKLWRTVYQNRWFGSVWAPTREKALAKIRAMNPLHLPEDFTVSDEPQAAFRKAAKR